MSKLSGSLTVWRKLWERAFNYMKSRQIWLPASFLCWIYLQCPPPSPFARLRSFTPCPACHHPTKYWNNVALNLTALLIKRATWLLISKLPSHYVALSKKLLTSSSQEHSPLLASEWILPIQFAGCSKLKMPADCWFRRPHVQPLVHTWNYLNAVWRLQQKFCN